MVVAVDGIDKQRITVRVVPIISHGNFTGRCEFCTWYEQDVIREAGRRSIQHDGVSIIHRVVFDRHRTGIASIVNQFDADAGELLERLANCSAMWVRTKFKQNGFGREPIAEVRIAEDHVVADFQAV